MVPIDAPTRAFVENAQALMLAKDDGDFRFAAHQPGAVLQGMFGQRIIDAQQEAAYSGQRKCGPHNACLLMLAGQAQLHASSRPQPCAVHRRSVQAPLPPLRMSVPIQGC